MLLNLQYDLVYSYRNGTRTEDVHAGMNQLIKDIEVEIESFQALLPKSVNMSVPGGRNKRGLVNVDVYILLLSQ